MKIHEKINPFSWSRRTILTVAVAFYAIFLPVYFYLGIRAVSASSGSAGRVSIPAVSISAGINEVEMDENGNFTTPDYVVGAYHPSENKTFLFAHSTSAFRNLDEISLDDEVVYRDETYTVNKIEIQPVEEIDMNALLRDSGEKSLVLMTCSGTEKNGKFDARLIVTATLE